MKSYISVDLDRRSRRRFELDNRKAHRIWFGQHKTPMPTRTLSRKPQKIAKRADRHIATVLDWLGDDATVAKLLSMPLKHRRNEATRIVGVVMPQIRAAKAAGKQHRIAVE